ncbi:hypothetical protein F5Y10DRAFT_247317 [Nemania abortiva]|nr:hypothetical protein F5Y10DRAFT_247317 [Nemania abortiva]
MDIKSVLNPMEETALIEAGGTDEEGEFAMSDYDEESMAESMSVNSSIFQHNFYNGRRYHRYRYIAFLVRIGIVARWRIY